MMLLSLSTTLKYLPLLLPMKSEFGTPKIVKNFLEFRFQDLNVTQFPLLMMEKVLFQVGLMEKFVPFFLNLVNFSLSLMMLIIMAVLPLLLPLMARELSLEELKDKFVSGK